jgi:hypothetical protein
MHLIKKAMKLSGLSKNHNYSCTWKLIQCASGIQTKTCFRSDMTIEICETNCIFNATVGKMAEALNHTVIQVKLVHISDTLCRFVSDTVSFTDVDQGGDKIFFESIFTTFKVSSIF